MFRRRIASAWYAATAALACGCLAGLAVPCHAQPRHRPSHPQATTAAPAQAPSRPAAATPSAPTPAPAAGTPPTPGTSAPAGAPAVAAAVVPAPAPPVVAPEDPRLAQVFSVFDGNCAGCHQSGRLTVAGPGGGMGAILDLANLARQPQWVRPGEPDASVLYQTLLDRHRPLDLPAEAAWPNADDISRVRTWISELPRALACETDAPLSDEQIAQAIDQALLPQGEAAARELRFITLSHLAAACATPAEMETYRSAVSKLLNSLSWGSRPVIPVAIDPQKTILSFRLSDIGWVDEHWAMLERAEPRGVATNLTKWLKAPSANPRPIRGDWLASAALRPPFYAELLGLPSSLDELTRLLGINRRGDLADGRTMRAGLRSSLATRGPRVIERFRADARRLWLTHDFADANGDHDIFDRPLGGIRLAPEKYHYHSDSLRAIFTLPNGFLAYTMFEPDGKRIDRLPTRLELEPAKGAGPAMVAQTCAGCHTSGLKPFTDAMRSHLTSDKFTAGREMRDIALGLYEPQAEWNRVIDEDTTRFRRALTTAGIDPDATVAGLEPISALAQRYTRDADLITAAAEAGAPLTAFDGKLDKIALAERSLVPRLRQGLLSRAELNRLLVAFDAPAGATPEPLAPPQPTTGETMSLALWTDRAEYKQGDLMTVYAQPSAPCYLTLISVAASGKATILFPSEFDPDNLVRPEAPFALPGDKAHYQFRLKEPGTETIVGRCQTNNKLPAGVETDYERQRFTVLGSYDNFLRASYGLEGQRPAVKPAAKAPGTKPEAIARAAVSISIK